MNKKIQMAEGAYIKIPEEWIVVNEEEAIQCKYAHALQINNTSGNFGDFGTYLMFSNKPNLTNGDVEVFYEDQLKINPEFARVTRPSEEPKPEFKEINGFVINISDFKLQKLGFIGAFSIEDAGKHPIAKVPYGVAVVRNNSKGNSDDE